MGWSLTGMCVEASQFMMDSTDRVIRRESRLLIDRNLLVLDQAGAVHISSYDPGIADRTGIPEPDPAPLRLALIDPCQRPNGQMGRARVPIESIPGRRGVSARR